MVRKREIEWENEKRNFRRKSEICFVYQNLYSSEMKYSPEKPKCEKGKENNVESVFKWNSMICTNFQVGDN